MTAYRNVYNTRQTPQSQPIPGTTQVANNAGGFVWAVDDWQRLERFLILGTEGGSYYASEQTLTLENAEAVKRCVSLDGGRVVEQVVAISKSGRAAKNDPALFALAVCMAFGSDATKYMARMAIPQVCRIGTHLFHFAEYVNGMRGWGRSLKRGVAGWYEGMDVGQLADQMVKYQQRDGWGHDDLIKLSHPKSSDDSRRGQLYDYALGVRKADARGDDGSYGRQLIESASEEDARCAVIFAFEAAKRLTDSTVDRRALIKLIQTYRLTREMVPTWALNHADVWESLLIDMPMEAMTRNLGNMSKVGLLRPLSAAAKTVVLRLGDEERIKRSRLHPIKILTALKVYGSGKGMRGSNSWDVVSQIVDALDGAFYLAFQNVVPTGKNTMLALDVSGSMTSGSVAGAPLTPREASAAMALVTANVEPNYVIGGFTSGNGKAQTFLTHHRTDGFSLLDISPKQRLDDVVRKISGLPFGGTDCALPMQYAQKAGLDIDAFVVYTDSETWNGKVHPVQALRQYRAARNRPAKSVVVSMLPNAFSIADPNDAGMLDVVGMDTGTPDLITTFMRGEVPEAPHPSDFLV